MTRVTALALLATIGLSGCISCTNSNRVQASRDFTLTAEWNDYEQVVVLSRNGRIELNAGSGTDIQIDGKLRVRGDTQAAAEAHLDELVVLAAVDPGDPRTFRIEFKVPERLKNYSPGAELIVNLPHACAAHANTSNGSIRVKGLKGKVVLDTSNGAVHAEHIDGDLTVDTSNGRIVVLNVTGSCVLDTSNGAVEVTDVSGDLRVDTSNGSIQVDSDPPPDSDVILHTSNGSITATVPAAMTGEVKLDTSNGRVNVDFGDIPAKIHRRGKTHVTATLNDGGDGRIVADTSNGSITLKFKK
ncbi:MAG: DUF4097 family beta strand repeat-containing protein [Planctomycetota bacterium]